MKGDYSSGAPIEERWPSWGSQGNSSLELDEQQNAMHGALTDIGDGSNFARAAAGKADRLADATTDEKLAGYASSLEGIGPNSDLDLLSLQSRLLIDTIVESRINEEILSADTERKLPDWLAKANMYLKVLG